MNYYDIKPLITNGSIVLFSGPGPLSRTVRWATKSEWSHIGLTMPLLGRWRILESTILNTTSTPMFSETRQMGVQISDLEERVTDYKGAIAFRMLKGINLPSKRTEAFYESVKGRSYEWDLWEFISAGIDFWHIFKNRPDYARLFCSELTAMFYQRMGILSSYVTPNEFTPADFDEGGMFDRGIQHPDVWFTKKIRLDKSKT